MASNLPAKREKVLGVKTFLQKYQTYIQEILPQHIKPEQMIRFTLLTINNNPSLALCTSESILRAVMEAGSLGLMPGMLNQAHFVPYKDKCQFQIGYGGLVELALRSGKVGFVEARAVYKGDRFAYEYGLNPILSHKDTHDPDKITPDGEHITHAYAIITYVRGDKPFHVMERKKILSIRNSSAGWQAHKKYGKSTPWITHAEEMFKKTVLRQRLKLDPQSSELSQAIQYDMAQDAGKQYRLIDTTIEIPKDKSEPEPITKSEELAQEKEPAKEPVQEPTPEQKDAPPFNPKSVEIAGKIQHEVSARHISEELFFKWMRELGMNSNQELVMNKPEQLEKLLKKCTAFSS